MHRIDTVNVATVLPASGAVGSTVGYFQNANPELDQEPTKLDAAWFNSVQEELMAILAQAGISPTKGTHTQVRDAILTLIAADGGAGLSQGYLYGCKMEWASASSITIGVGKFRDEADTITLTIPTPITVSLATSGVNGLDTGAEANSTWYYPFLIYNPTSQTIASVFSINAVTPTLPSGYTKYRRLKGAWRNDSGGNLIPMECITGWPHHPFWKYKEVMLSADIASPLNVLNNGSATTFTDVSLSALVPPECKLAYLITSGSLASSTIYNIRRKGDSGSGKELFTRATMDSFQNDFWMETDAAQTIQYKVSNGSALMDISVGGFSLST